MAEKPVISPATEPNQPAVKGYPKLAPPPAKGPKHIQPPDKP